MEETHLVRNPLIRGLLIAAGILSVALGLIGVVVPVLPTTPFLLLAAACFVRSSPRLHHWLLHNRFFGEVLRRYRAGEGLSLAHKVVSLSLLWVMLAVSIVRHIPPHMLWVKLLLLGIGVAVTQHLLRLPTRKS